MFHILSSEIEYDSPIVGVSWAVSRWTRVEALLSPLHADGLARRPRLADVTRKVRFYCTLSGMPPLGCVAVALFQLILSAARLSLRADGRVRS